MLRVVLPQEPRFGEEFLDVTVHPLDIFESWRVQWRGSLLWVRIRCKGGEEGVKGEGNRVGQVVAFHITCCRKGDDGVAQGQRFV